MHPPRRSFMKSATLTAVSAGLVVSANRLTFSKNPLRSENPLKRTQGKFFSLRRETFEPYIGDVFHAPNARGRMVSLTLLEVRNYKVNDRTKVSTKPGRELRSFSLTFSSSERLPQLTSIHKVSHPALGEFDLFMTSHQKKDRTFRYEAAFSHI